MSSSDRSQKNQPAGIEALPSRRRILLVLAGVAALPLGGCLRPLYASGPAGLAGALRAIRVEQIGAATDGSVLAHTLRQELVFALDGSGAGPNDGTKLYTLNTTVTFSTQTPIVSATTLRASVATLVGSASYTLSPIGGEMIESGTVSGSATYERTAQRFANVRAGRDAQIRLGKQLADEIRTRLAIALRSRAVG